MEEEEVLRVVAPGGLLLCFHTRTLLKALALLVANLPAWKGVPAGALSWAIDFVFWGLPSNTATTMLVSPLEPPGSKDFVVANDVIVPPHPEDSDR